MAGEAWDRDRRDEVIVGKLHPDRLARRREAFRNEDVDEPPGLDPIAVEIAHGLLERRRSGRKLERFFVGDARRLTIFLILDAGRLVDDPVEIKAQRIDVCVGQVRRR
jgi:hypothetical protein